MIVEIEKHIGVLLNLKISPSQFLFCFLTHQHLHAELYRYIEEGPGWSAEELLDLQKRGLVLNLNQGTQTFPDLYVVDDKFVNLVFSEDKERTGMECWNAFPAELNIDGKSFPGRNMDQDQFLKDYYGLIGHSPEKHKRVLEALEFAKRSGKIRQGLKMWFATRQWEFVLQQMTSYDVKRDLLF